MIAANRPALIKRPTIGMMTRSMGSDVSILEWSGVIHAAARHGVNLICFSAREPSEPEMSEREPLFRLVDPARLDGLILWTAMLNRFADGDALEIFAQRFAGLPCISTEQRLGDLPTVTMDDYQGMWDVIEHLIVAHDCRRIAFIQGPPGHLGLRVRYQAYVDCLAAHGLSHEAARVSPACDFAAQDAKLATLALLDRPDSRIDAIVGPSESFALGIMDALAERGIAVPSAMAVAGFDDTFELQRTVPPITTTAAPLAEIGGKAVDLIVAQLAGQPIPRHVALAAPAVIRQSCGCLDSRLLRAVDSLPAAGLAIPFAEVQRQLVARLRSCSYGEALITATRSFVDRYAELVLSDAGAVPRSFLTILSETIRLLVRSGIDLPAWQDALSVLRSVFRERPLSAPLWHVLSVAITQESQQGLSLQLTHAKNINILLSEFGHAIATYDVDRIFRILPDWLPQLGVLACFIAFYEDGELPDGMAQLKFAYTDGHRRELPVDGVRFDPRNVLPDAYTPADRPYSWLVEPLSFEAHQIGFIVFEISHHDGIVYETIRTLMCNGLLGSQLVSKLQARSLALEHSLEVLKNAQQSLVQAEKLASLGRMVAGIAHELNTPLGCSITATSTLLDQLRRLRSAIDKASLRRSQLDHFIQEFDEGIDITQRNLFRAADMVDKFRQVAVDQTSEQRREFDLLDFVAEVQMTLSPSFKHTPIRLHTDVPSGLQFDSYPGPLSQVLINLLLNALTHAFTARNEGNLWITVDTPRAKWIRLVIRDDGVGMSDEVREHIFDPFFTTRLGQGGSGLGLSIVYNIVTGLLGGTVIVHSRPGEGAEFVVEIPRCAPEPTPASAAGEPGLS